MRPREDGAGAPPAEKRFAIRQQGTDAILAHGTVPALKHLLVDLKPYESGDDWARVVRLPLPRRRRHA